MFHIIFVYRVDAVSKSKLYKYRRSAKISFGLIDAGNGALFSGGSHSFARATVRENEIFGQKAGNIGQQVTLTRIDCYRVTVMVEQNFLTVRPFSLNPDDH